MMCPVCVPDRPHNSFCGFLFYIYFFKQGKSMPDTQICAWKELGFNRKFPQHKVFLAWILHNLNFIKYWPQWYFNNRLLTADIPTRLLRMWGSRVGWTTSFLPVKTINDTALRWLPVSKHLFKILLPLGKSAHACIDCMDWVYLCLTVEPAARGATVLLGDRPDAPTLGEIAAGIRWKKKWKCK